MQNTIKPIFKYLQAITATLKKKERKKKNEQNCELGVLI